MVFDERGVSMGHTTFVPSEAGLTKEVIFHKSGLSKDVLLYINLLLYHIDIHLIINCILVIICSKFIRISWQCPEPAILSCNLFRA